MTPNRLRAAPSSARRLCLSTLAALSALAVAPPGAAGTLQEASGPEASPPASPAGGPDAVTARMRRAGLDGIRVDRSTPRLIADWLGIGELPPEDELTPERSEALVDSIPEEVREAAGDAFPSDPRDTATPRDMTRLLAGLWHREVLSAESSDLLLDVMRRCRTGDRRLKGMLPPGTVVAR